MRRLKTAAGILATSLLLMGMLEGAVRVVASRRLIYSIEMLRYALLLKVPGPTPEISHRHRPSASATLMGVEVRTNSLGHRGAELETPKPANVYRVLVMGNSVTLGWGVREERVFSSLLRNQMNERKPFGDKRVEVTNAGVGNYNAVLQNYLLEEQLDRVQPDRVVLHYFVDDAEPSPVRNGAWLGQSYVAALTRQRLAKASFRWREQGNLSLYYEALHREDGEDWRRTARALTDIRKRLEARGIPLDVILIPSMHDLGAALTPLYSSIETKLSDLELRPLNLFPAFHARFGANAREAWVQADDAHPNELGHALMANEFTKKFFPAQEKKEATWRTSKAF